MLSSAIRKAAAPENRALQDPTRAPGAAGIRQVPGPWARDRSAGTVPMRKIQACLGEVVSSGRKNCTSEGKDLFRACYVFRRADVRGTGESLSRYSLEHGPGFKLLSVRGLFVPVTLWAIRFPFQREQAVPSTIRTLPTTTGEEAQAEGRTRSSVAQGRKRLSGKV